MVGLKVLLLVLSFDNYHRAGPVLRDSQLSTCLHFFCKKIPYLLYVLQRGTQFVSSIWNHVYYNTWLYIAAVYLLHTTIYYALHKKT